ncbi:CopG family antitoxin [Roseospira visakhapatnamensis]|uniref:Putative DNA binding CopG/RHH family protein n=1 Tax=Roseospira visakhapatnamensis TaxID=390880 RepID=A0A7W6WBG0_9PROT|nr:CopG family antitoxin [Roseospira visakhapatnamensis]MBB4267180.1 putative DNA binding CopG/RHH family protein [Roseospira visakhapatnamensis]MBB4268295.1 putative DNA binding CopG/RHH family protein [Roseospira visakhapatnamensis]
MSDTPDSKGTPLPRHETDAEAERFVEAADLTAYDLSGFQPARFEFGRKDARVNMRLPEPLLDAVKARASARGMPYQRFIREAIERALSGDRP